MKTPSVQFARRQNIKICIIKKSSDRLIRAVPLALQVQYNIEMNHCFLVGNDLANINTLAWKSRNHSTVTPSLGYVFVS